MNSSSVSAVPLVAAASAQRWLLEQQRGDPAARQVLVVDLAQSGCSGWAYRPAWHAELPGDPAGFVTTTVQGDAGNALTLAYPVAHADKMAGVVLDYVREGLSSRLVFQNPQVTDACGCGASVHFGKAA